MLSRRLSGEAEASAGVQPLKAKALPSCADIAASSSSMRCGWDFHVEESTTAVSFPAASSEHAHARPSEARVETRVEIVRGVASHDAQARVDRAQPH